MKEIVDYDEENLEHKIAFTRALRNLGAYSTQFIPEVDGYRLITEEKEFKVYEKIPENFTTLLDIKKPTLIIRDLPQH